MTAHPVWPRRRSRWVQSLTRERDAESYRIIADMGSRSYENMSTAVCW
jgi:hypothetical protein